MCNRATSCPHRTFKANLVNKKVQQLVQQNHVLEVALKKLKFLIIEQRISGLHTETVSPTETDSS